MHCIKSGVYRLADLSGQGTVCGDQLLGRRAGSAGADDAAIHLDDGNDLGAGAGEETFVGVEDVVAGQVRLGDLDAGLAGEVDDRGAGDAVERAGGIRPRSPRS
jgi:hypothetical protein